MSINLPVVIHGSENLFLTTREAHRLHVFEYRLLRKPFVLMLDEMLDIRGKLHNKDVYNLYTSASIVSMTKTRKK
jgi:hypothetical protein